MIEHISICRLLVVVEHTAKWLLCLIGHVVAYRQLLLVEHIADMLLLKIIEHAMACRLLLLAEWVTSRLLLLLLKECVIILLRRQNIWRLRVLRVLLIDREKIFYSLHVEAITCGLGLLL